MKKFLYSRTQFWFNLKAGGSVGHTVGVIRGLQRFGDVYVVANETPYGVEDLPNMILSPKFTSPRFIAETLYNFEYEPFLRNYVNKIKPDYIYHRYSGLSYATAKVSKQLNIPLALEYNSSELWTMKHWDKQTVIRKASNILRRKLIQTIEKYNLQHASLVIVVSKVLKDTLIRSGVSSSKILVNPNGVDPDVFCPLSILENNQTKNKYQISENQVVIGYSGTFGEWHGIPEMAEAIYELNQDAYYRAKLHFVLFGDGKLRPLIEQKIGHFENVTFTGIIPYKDIARMISMCDILLSPHGKTPDGESFFGSPTKLFEYMSMSKGIIASNLDQLGEVIEHKRTGWLVEPGNVQQLISGIKTLSDNVDLRVSLGIAARDEVKASYTWESHVNRTIYALQSL